MKKLIGTFMGLFVLAMCVNIGLILIDDGSPPETLKEYIVELVGVLSVMIAIPFAKHISNTISGE